MAPHAVYVADGGQRPDSMYVTDRPDNLYGAIAAAGVRGFNNLPERVRVPDWAVIFPRHPRAAERPAPRGYSAMADVPAAPVPSAVIASNILRQLRLHVWSLESTLADVRESLGQGLRLYTSTLDRPSSWTGPPLQSLKTAAEQTRVISSELHAVQRHLNSSGGPATDVEILQDRKRHQTHFPGDVERNHKEDVQQRDWGGCPDGFVSSYIWWDMSAPTYPPGQSYVHICIVCICIVASSFPRPQTVNLGELRSPRRSGARM